MVNSIAKEMLRHPPEIYESDPSRPGSAKDMRVQLDDKDVRIRIPRPTPALKRWISGKSKDYSDAMVAKLTKMSEHRIVSFRSGCLPESWEARRLSDFFAYPEDRIVLLLFVYARKRLQKMLNDLSMVSDNAGTRHVLAIVPERLAKKHKLPIFRLEGIGKPMYGVTRDLEILDLQRKGD